MKSPSRARTLPAANRFLLSLLLSGVLLLLLQPAAAQQDLSSSVQLRLEMFVVSKVDGREQYTPSITRAGRQLIPHPRGQPRRWFAAGRYRDNHRTDPE